MSVHPDTQVRRAALVAQVRKLTQDGTAKRLRQAAHLSLADVGAAIGTSAVNVWRWEEGLNTPRPDACVRYGAVLAELLELDGGPDQ